MIAIIDLDHTLLDTNRLKARMESELAQLGLSHAAFIESYERTVHSSDAAYGYELARHAAVIEEMAGIPAGESVAALGRAFAQADGLLYDDAASFLRFLRKAGMRVVLLTLGEPGFQREKCRRLGIEQYFDGMLFTAGAKEDLALTFDEPQKDWLFVNDNPAELRALKVRYPESRMYRVRRPGGKTFAPADDALDVPTYPSLDQVAERIRADLKTD